MPQRDENHDWVQYLFVKRLLRSSCLHVPSPLMTKYRNKATYSIPIIEFSSLVQENVQDVCRWINEQVCGSSERNQILLTEVMVKSTRKAELLVRLSLAYGSDATTTTATTKGRYFESFCKQLQSTFPAIACLCYNTEPSPGTRPSKSDPLVFLTPRQKHVWETTPDGRHRYRLGPDTFSEVNPTVEQQQYAQTQEWIATMQSTANSNNNAQHTLLVSGRDISVFALGYGESFAKVLAIQHCPLVHQDAMLNLQNDAKYSVFFCPNKGDMARTLAPHASSIHGAVLTGGRKGLDPSYVDFLTSHANIQFVVYNSCCTTSLVRDMRGLLTAFRVQDFRQYDFFPGTKYTASLTLLVRRRGPTLVLPVGPAGVGKSTLARLLATVGASVWERDAAWASVRTITPSMAETKRQVHAQLLEFLQRSQQLPSQNRIPILVVDTTNGNAAARELYAETSQPEAVILVSFVTNNVDFLLQRTARRLSSQEGELPAENHPSFPTTLVEQRVKHENILKGIEFPSEKEMERILHSDCTTRVVKIRVDPEQSNRNDVFLAVMTTLAISGELLEALALDGVVELHKG